MILIIPNPDNETVKDRKTKQSNKKENFKNGRRIFLSITDAKFSTIYHMKWEIGCLQNIIPAWLELVEELAPFS